MNEKRELIIKAAFKVFSEKGYYNTKIEEIADEAGIGKGTVYSYFDNKQDVFDKMVFWFLDKYFQELEDGIDFKDSIEVIINKFIYNHIDIILKTKATFMNVMTEFSNIPREKEEILDFHKKFVFEKTDRYTKLFEKAQERGEMREISPVLAANFLLGALKGISESLILFEQEENGEKIAREVTDLLCYGIAKRDPA